MTGSRSFLAELKRRNVWRAAAIYIAAVWALSQGIAQLGPLFHAPDWAMRWFVIACVVGFPFWIAFAWFYAWTPHDFRRGKDVAHDLARSHAIGRKLDFWIIGVLALAVVLLVTNQFVLHRDVTSVANEAADRATAVANKAALATLTEVSEKSVAVLPFINDSGDLKQQYFSDGLSEELISDLTQLNGLKVISRYSSFKFRNSKESPAEIGAALGVAHLIEGSVFQNGAQMRITVNLIRASDGASLWSHVYDKPLKDLFAIQSGIGKAVGAALKVKLLGPTPGDDVKPPDGNVHAYQLMLQGRAIANRESKAGFEQGLALLEQAVQIDPGYAYAWATLANLRLEYGGKYLSGDAWQDMQTRARTALDHATTLAPDAVATLTVRARVALSLDHDGTVASAILQRAHALAPRDGTVMEFLGIQYSIAGQWPQAVDLFRKAIDTNPLAASWYANLSRPLLALGRLDEAEQAMRKAQALNPNLDMQAQLSLIDILRGDAAAALRNADKATDSDSKAFAIALAKQGASNAREADAALKFYVAKYGKSEPYTVADLYAARKQPDAMFEWLDRARRSSIPAATAGLLTDPLILRYRHDPRFAKLCRQLGLPVPDEISPAGSTSSIQPAVAASTR